MMKKLISTLTLTLALAASPVFAKGPKAPGDASIVDIAVSTGMHTTLVDLVTEAGLAGVLANQGQFTVFAPTDDAFGADADGIIGVLAGICGDDKKIGALTNVLLHHVADGRRFSNSVLGKRGPKPIETLGGEYIWVDSDGNITDGAGNTNVAYIDTITPLFNVSASNGVVHSLEGGFLLPATVCPMNPDPM
jgi:uncharacterized surface protein with fasciclin (FAS1) repeats